MTQSIGIQEFMCILSDIWPDWVSKESLVKASNRVGISSAGFNNVDSMQTSKFEQAELNVS